MMQRTGTDLAQRVAQVGELARAGVRLVAGSDSGISPGKPHGILPYAVGQHAEVVGAPVALAAATSGAADALGLGGITGRLRAGLAADLLVVDGDPTRRIDDLVRVRRVVCRGAATGP